MSSTRQQIFSTCFIVSDQFCLITQTSSGSFSYIVTGVKGTYFIHHLQSTNHVPVQVLTAKNTYRLSAGCDKTPAWLWEYCRFILGLTSIYLKKKNLFGMRGLTMLHFLWPRALLFQSLEMLIPNLLTIENQFLPICENCATFE